MGDASGSDSSRPGSSDAGSRGPGPPDGQTYSMCPATPERWADVVAVMGTRGDPSTCWCQFFHLRNADWARTPVEARQAALHGQVCAGGPAPGVLAYRAGEPVGWCQVGPKLGYTRLTTAKVAAAAKDAPDPDGLWVVTCFVVPVAHRRAGVADALLAGAVDHARRAGASALEGYPVETGGAGRRSADLYHGTVSMFERSGFVEVRRPTPGRVVMRLAFAEISRRA